ncbi:Aste57867_428 [Aphanomyces stellatus]|uniref:Aste57867_428 protein n=1 Tax=Aphanomyces stellatus TaxID=120398 RepID=A0A485K7K3_9STRA|nr:hypothetical protein As57867_000427 [Aphanomyces stellatus]VFT77653.1 Aste57867_428 [Aphanomyces stellatus]
MWRLSKSLQLRAFQRSFSTPPSTGRQYEVGSVIHGFEVLKKQAIPEFSVTALQLQHVETKAEYLHIDTVDTNNVFSINFRTPPYSSNGIAHILEHLVLCGSKQFPVRDPFFNMLKRSLNNFMNAMTANDHTMYPFATTNAKDFENLMAVYLDAVFFPTLDRLDFAQEGHRMELDADDKSTLHFKGVVLNEMKGVLSDSQTLFATRLQQLVMQNSIYQHVSGGDPADLTSLTYDELRAFHKNQYHPSNCLFYSYGHLPLENHLKTIATTVLPHFPPTGAPQPTIIHPMPQPSSMSTIETHHLEGPDDGVSPTAAAQTKWCHSHVIPSILSTDTYECFLLRLLSYLLLNGPSAPLYKALITSELAVDFAAGTGLDTSTINPSFGIGVEGFEADKLETIKAVISSTLAQVVQDGFDVARIDAVLHQIELSQKHIVGKFGMSLLRAASSTWVHRGDMLENLSIDPLLDRFHRDMQANPHFLQEMLEKYLVAPRMTSGVAVLMTPSTTFVGELEDAERAKLAAVRETLSADDVAAIDAKAAALAAHQQQVPKVECLPTLVVGDIPLDQPRLEVETRGAIQFVPQTTNELSYIRFKFDTSDVPADLRWFIPLFSSLLGQLGTSQHSFHALPTVLQTVCGGVSCAHLILPDIDNANSSHAETLLVETLCLPQHLDATLDLVSQLFGDTQYTSPDNLQQLKSLLISATAAANASVASSGHSLAAYRAQLGLTSSAMPSECARGLSSMQALQMWTHAIEQDPAALVTLGATLARLAGLCFRPDRMQLSVVTEPHLVASVEQSLTRMTWQPTTTLDGTSLAVPTLPTPLAQAFFGFPISVNFNVQTFPSVSLFHDDHAPLSILAQVLSSCHLHQHVRERGGAYGCSASQGEGTFSMSSYYDPHTTRTFDAYADAVSFAVDGRFSDRDVNEALLATFSAIDSPQAPSSKGKGLFTRGFTHEMLQRRRAQLLLVTKSDLVRVAQTHLGSATSQKAVVGKEEGRDALTDLGFQ